MTLHHYRILSRIIRAELARAKITPEDAEVMLKHITNPDPRGHAKFWRDNCIALAVALAGSGLIFALTLAL